MCHSNRKLVISTLTYQQSNENGHNRKGLFNMRIEPCIALLVYDVQFSNAHV